MLAKIDKLDGLGVFDGYAAPKDIEPFAQKNLIYGWNYSGKTTLARVLRALQHGRVPDGFPNASFRISCHSGEALTEKTPSEDRPKVRVFNTDFVTDNLKWDGTEFDPILLLGEESIDAQKRIAANERQIEILREKERHLREQSSTLARALSDSKTERAKSIRKDLSITDTFTATHLNQLLAQIEETSAADYVLSASQFAATRDQALASDEDRRQRLQAATIAPRLVALAGGLADLLSGAPKMTTVIEDLAKDGTLAEWVRQGLKLHSERAACEFCGNRLTEQRREQLKAHFSRDLESYEAKLNGRRQATAQAAIQAPRLDARDFYPSVRKDYEASAKTLGTALEEYNQEVDRITSALDTKLWNPFTPVSAPAVNLDCDAAVQAAAAQLNQAIEKNNEITDSFDKTRAAALLAAKRHHAAEWCVSQSVRRNKSRQARLSTCLRLIQVKIADLQEQNAQLNAQISRAQKGREVLNEYVARFLPESGIEIEVVTSGQEERFRITRAGTRATNLSEGEKTAIAFAFFLVKLKEDQDLGDLIVYIDDPVSSLDSNHLFQMNACIRDFFFVQSGTNPQEWSLRVQQIFLATHNFEFFGLLRELPVRKKTKCKYYLVKRVECARSSLTNMPSSIKRYSSEYQYLWSVLYRFHESTDKGDIEVLLGLPNAVRRFLELYTYAKIPTSRDVSVDERAKRIFGTESAKRLVKVLHYFSHSNDIMGLSQNSDLLCDIEAVVAALIDHVRADSMHYEALMASMDADV